jgi:hypothetical protein
VVHISFLPCPGYPRIVIRIRVITGCSIIPVSRRPNQMQRMMDLGPGRWTRGVSGGQSESSVYESRP